MNCTKFFVEIQTNKTRYTKHNFIFQQFETKGMPVFSNVCLYITKRTIHHNMYLYQTHINVDVNIHKISESGIIFLLAKETKKTKSTITHTHPINVK